MHPFKLVVIGLLISIAGIMQAQVSIGVNIGTYPPWGPPVQANVRYYYLPDVDAYYDLNTSLFVYSYNGNWIHRRHLPGRFRNYDLYRGHKVIVSDYSGNAPYSHYNYHKNRSKDRNYERMIERAERVNHRYNDRNSHEDYYRRNDKKSGEDKMKFARDNNSNNGQGNQSY